MLKVTALTIATMAVVSMAQAETYMCDLERGAGGGWIAPVVLVDIDPERRTAQVKDDLTLRRVNGWYPAEIKVDNQKRYTVGWTLSHSKDSSRQTANLQYRLSIRKDSGKATASMIPLGYDNKFMSKGKCVKR